MPHNFLSDNNTLDMSAHSKSNTSIIDDFLQELATHIAKMQSSSLLKTLNRYTILTCAEIDNSFATCFDYNEKKIYYVPTKRITGNMPVPGDALKINSDGSFYVDYTAIFTEPDVLKSSFEECHIAK